MAIPRCEIWPLTLIFSCSWPVSIAARFSTAFNASMAFIPEPTTRTFRHTISVCIILAESPTARAAIAWHKRRHRGERTPLAKYVDDDICVLEEIGRRNLRLHSPNRNGYSGGGRERAHA